MVTPSLPLSCLQIIQQENIGIIRVESLDPGKESGHELDKHDARFADTWTKLRAFEIDGFEVSERGGAEGLERFSVICCVVTLADSASSVQIRPIARLASYPECHYHGLRFSSSSAFFLFYSVLPARCPPRLRYDNPSKHGRIVRNAITRRRLDKCRSCMYM